MPLTERGIQAKAGLVDEVIHVAFDAAVVVAEKDHPPLAGDKHPTREVDRANAPQMAGSCNMARCEIHGAEHSDDGERSGRAPACRLPIALN